MDEPKPPPLLPEDRFPSAARRDLRSAIGVVTWMCVLGALLLALSGLQQLDRVQGWAMLLGAALLGFLAWSCYTLRPWSRWLAIAIGALGLLLVARDVIATLWDLPESRGAITGWLLFRWTVAFAVSFGLLLHFLPARAARRFELAHSTYTPTARRQPAPPPESRPQAP